MAKVSAVIGIENADVWTDGLSRFFFAAWIALNGVYVLPPVGVTSTKSLGTARVRRTSEKKILKMLRLVGASALGAKRLPTLLGMGNFLDYAVSGQPAKQLTGKRWKTGHRFINKARLYAQVTGFLSLEDTFKLNIMNSR